MFRIFEGFSTYYLASVAKGSVTSFSTTALKNLTCALGTKHVTSAVLPFGIRRYALELNSKLAPEGWNAKL